jgi:hypothetical protein
MCAEEHWGPIEKNRPNKNKKNFARSEADAQSSTLVQLHGTKTYWLCAQGFTSTSMFSRRKLINDLCILAGILALMKARGAARPRGSLESRF